MAKAPEIAALGGVGVGVALGVSLGVAMESLPAGIAMAAGFAVLWAVVFHRAAVNRAKGGGNAEQ
ncbi:hypothetical protein DDZ18_06100 [Marinicauda salina]|uniref:Uncharacterized protein n=1 Tax=Marinicauda salina TaxID=2135793 RepID=A0A2U2BTE6_9PROT|nr:hypothetical protein [Marinicauda salina]PWE17260.1 hypothetical protein DDZ18_06100 [Marinicauda salina]